MGRRSNLHSVPEEFRKAAPKPDIRSVADLMVRELPPVRWVVPKILPEGVTLLAGKAKVRKSWLAMGLCVAVSTGGYAFGHIPVQRGEVLYAALEDNERRIQSRLGKVLEGARVTDPPVGMFYTTQLPRLDEGGTEALVSWLEEHPDCRMVVIDTLAKVRPRSRNGSSGGYQEDYEALEALLPVAAKYRVAILVVTHTRKAGATDVLDEINATMGLMGGVDGFLIMRSGRGTSEGGSSATMHVDGREIEEPGEVALTWDTEITGWRLLGDAAEMRMSQDRRLILEILVSASEPIKTQALVKALGKSGPAVSNLLKDLMMDGRVVRAGHGLWVATKYGDDWRDQVTGDLANSPTLGGSEFENEFENGQKADTYKESDSNSLNSPNSQEANVNSSGEVHLLRDEFVNFDGVPPESPHGKAKNEHRSNSLARNELDEFDHGRNCTCEMCQGDA